MSESGFYANGKKNHLKFIHQEFLEEMELQKVKFYPKKGEIKKRINILYSEYLEEIKKSDYNLY